MDRREFLGVSLVIPAALTFAPRAGGQARPTPACGAATVTRIVVEGTVLDTDCKPMPKALIDVWHADAVGEYDNSGYRMRGHQFTDAEGKFRLQTIVPGNYPGRTRHFHVKVQAQGGRVLTTQLYFPDEPNNRRDGIFTPELVMKVKDVEGGKLAAFDFVLPKSRA
jgi:protocatechuate 3,4-dioxygenase beta subunit